MITEGSLTDDQIIALFEEHCECRPTNVYRESHSHDCGDDVTEMCRVAMAAPLNSLRRMTARGEIAEIINEILNERTDK